MYEMETQIALTGFKAICFMLLCFPLESECRNNEQIEKRLNILEQKFGFHAYEYTLMQQNIHKIQDRLQNVEVVTVETEGDLAKTEYNVGEVKQMDFTEVNQKLTELVDVSCSLLNAFKNEKKERIRIEMELETLKESQRNNEVDVEIFAKSHRQEMVDMQYKIDKLKSSKQSIEDSLITEHLQTTENKYFQISEKLENIDNLQHSFVKEDVFKQQTEATGSKLSAMAIVLNDLARSMEEKYQSVATKVTGISESQQQHVSFSAIQRNTTSTFWNKFRFFNFREVVIVFDEVITNIGNAYSGVTGVFTAPYDGIYVFYTHIHESDHQIGVNLQKNGRWLSLHGSIREGESNLVILQLVKGDTVMMVKQSHSGRTQFSIRKVGNTGTFSGYMLYPI